MSDFGFLYQLTHANTGDLFVTENVTGNKIGMMLEHIAKTVNQHEGICGKGNVKVTMLKARLGEEHVIVEPKKMESLTTLVFLATEHYTQKAGKLVVESYRPDQIKVVENLKKVLLNPKKAKKLAEALDDDTLELPDLKIGDVLLAGKFKNKRCTIKGFDKDENGQPTADTDRGNQKIFKPRIAKIMPGAEDKKEEPVEENVQGDVRKRKEAHPEKFCSNAKCLWRLSNGPCPKHKDTMSRTLGQQGVQK